MIKRECTQNSPKNVVFSRKINRFNIIIFTIFGKKITLLNVIIFKKIKKNEKHHFLVPNVETPFE
jgi:hypothetical protein